MYCSDCDQIYDRRQIYGNIKRLYFYCNEGHEVDICIQDIYQITPPLPTPPKFSKIKNDPELELIEKIKKLIEAGAIVYAW